VRVLVCGGRNFTDSQWLYWFLDSFHKTYQIDVIIEGGAKGADRLARTWAINNNIPVETYEADWESHGRAAGPIRNAKMLIEGKPDYVIAFPGGTGTANMMEKARNASVPIIVPKKKGR
jgi:hypothetical protein